MGVTGGEKIAAGLGLAPGADRDRWGLAAAERGKRGDEGGVCDSKPLRLCRHDRADGFPQFPAMMPFGRITRVRKKATKKHPHPRVT